jgi:hypothetical protein
MERTVLVPLIFLLLDSHAVSGYWQLGSRCSAASRSLFVGLLSRAFGVIALYGRYSGIALGCRLPRGPLGNATSWEIGEAVGSIKGQATTAAEVP